MSQLIQSDVDGVSADRFFGAHISISEPAAKSATAALAATAMTSETQTITEGLTDPDVPRNATVKGNASGITGDVTINGTNYADEEISEVIALNGATEVQGNKAFKTFTSVELPAETHAGTDTVSIGLGDKLGIPYKLPHNTVLAAHLNNVKESTAPTVACSSTNIESNTVLLNSALDGNDVAIYLMV